MWSFHNPVQVTFGDGALGRISGIVDGRRYVLVTYDEPHFREMGARIVAEAGEPLVVIDDVSPNPNFVRLAKSCARFGALTETAEAIVALGGGSVIDTAKVLSASAGDFERVRRYLIDHEGEEALGSVPIIAIPTTAGTGSEVTSWASVWDTDAGRKYSLSRPDLYPEHALVDPELTAGMPRMLTVSTALDALSHSLESIWNVNANPVSTNLAVAAASEILEVLPALANDLGSQALRSRMAMAALLAGLAFSNTRTALAHSLSYPITLQYDLPHGLACSFSLPMLMLAVIGDDIECDAGLRSIFGEDLPAGVDHLADLLTDLGVSVSSEDHGVPREAFRNLITAAFVGERGRNFIGSNDRVMAAEEQQWEARNRLGNNAGRTDRNDTTSQ
jgi:alcohol dehydrogenase